MSVASLWELINKKEKRDSPLKDPVTCWDRYVVKPQTPVLPIHSQHVLYLDRLPMHHRDPYGRILVAQSAIEEMSLVTANTEIGKYGIRIRRATA